MGHFYFIEKLDLLYFFGFSKLVSQLKCPKCLSLGNQEENTPIQFVNIQFMFHIINSIFDQLSGIQYGKV